MKDKCANCTHDSTSTEEATVHVRAVVWEQTWHGHLPADGQRNLALGRGSAHETDDVAVGGVQNRVSVDVRDLVTNLQPPIQVCCTTSHNGPHRCLRGGWGGREKQVT